MVVDSKDETAFNRRRKTEIWMMLRHSSMCGPNIDNISLQS